MSVLALLLSLAAQETALVISLQTKDGNAVSGTTEVVSFPFESTLGKMTVQLQDVYSIRLEGAEAIVSTHDGTTLKGKIAIESWKIKTKLGEFTVKMSDVNSIMVQGMRAVPGVLPRPAGVSAKPAAEKPAGLAPDKTLKLAVAVSRVLRSADGKKLFILNASDSKVLVFNFETFEKEKEIALAGGETFLSLAPSGNVLVAGGKRTITLASIPQGKLTKSFPIEADITDLCAVDDNTVVASGGSQYLLVSIPKQAVISKVSGGSQGRLYLAKDGRKIYGAGAALLLPDKAHGREEIMVSPYVRGTSGDFNLSPDGRFAISPQGMVNRTGKSFAADMIEVGKVEPHWSSAWAPGLKRLYLATSGGFVKEYDTSTWELVRSFALGYRLTDSFVDEAGGFLVGVGAAVQPGTGNDSPRYAHQPAAVGDLYRFALPK